MYRLHFCRWDNFSNPVDVLFVPSLNGSCDDLTHVVRMVLWKFKFISFLLWSQLTLHKLCQLLYPRGSGFDHHQNFRVVLNFPLPLIHGGHPRQDVDTGCQLVGDQPACDLLRLVGVRGGDEGHGELLLRSRHTQMSGQSAGKESARVSEQIWHK